jgi:hypothetical protein
MRNLLLLLTIFIFAVSCKEKIQDSPIEIVEKIKIDTLSFKGVSFSTRFGVYDMKFDSKDRLWVGTTNGLLMYDQQTERWTRFDESNFPPPKGYSTDYIVEQIEIDNNDNVYVKVGQGNYPIYIFNGTNWKAEQLPGYLSYMKFDKRNNNLWLGTSGGLLLKNNGINKLYDKTNSPLITSPEPNTNSYEILRMDIEPNGTFWTTNSYSLMKFDGTNWENIDYREFPNKGWIMRITGIDNNGLIHLNRLDQSFVFDGKNIIRNTTDTLKKYGVDYIEQIYTNPQTNNSFIKAGFGILFNDRKRDTYKTLNSTNINFPPFLSSGVCIAFDSKGSAWIAKSSFIGKLPNDLK